MDIREGIISFELDAYIYLSVIVCNVIEEIFERDLEGDYFLGSTFVRPLGVRTGLTISRELYIRIELAESVFLE